GWVPPHEGPANINVLDDLVKMHTRLGGGFFKRVKVHDHHVNRLDAVLPRRRNVHRVGADVQNTAVHLGMQRLDPAVHHLWKPGQLGNVSDRDAGFRQQLSRAAGGNEVNVKVRQLLGKINQSSLVCHAQDGALNSGHDGFLGGGRIKE